jgi:hypothetical protein
MKNMDKLNRNLLPPEYNRSTRVFVIIFGILTGSGGTGHGIFEILQGNRPTDDILERIGAFTILPNYLLTGIATVIISLSVIIWTIGFIHKKHGPLIYLLLSVLLFLAGGGIAMISGFLLTWLVATRINKPLSWWNKVLPEKLKKTLAGIWLPVLVTGVLLFSTGMGIWLLFIPPGQANQVDTLDYICWSFLGIGFLILILSVIAGFARDIQRRNIQI